MTYHGPVELLQTGVAIKAIENARDETSRDEAHDANVVQFIAKLGNHW